MGGKPTVNVEGLSGVHQGSGGIATCEPPDVCMTMGPSGSPVPIPYTNVAQSLDLVGGTTSVLFDGMPVAIRGSSFAKSTGDEPGLIGGVMSATTALQAEFITYSMSVTAEGQPIGRLSDMMSMNNGNTATLSGEKQAPLSPALPNKSMMEPETPKPCTIDHLKVTCGHDERSYGVDFDKQRAPRLQVVSDANKPDKLKVSFDSHCSVLGQSPGCAKVRAEYLDGRKIEVGSDYTIELPIKRKLANGIHDWFDLIGHFGQIPAERCVIYGTTCGGIGDGEFPWGDFLLVDIFPNQSIEGELEIGYKHDQKKLKAKTQHHRDLEEEAEWELKGSIKATLGANDLSFPSLSSKGAGAKKDSDPISRRLFANAQKILSAMCREFAQINHFYNGKFEINWPCLKIGMQVNLVEAPEKGIVQPEGSFYIVADKLFGAGFTVDILDWLLLMASVAGPAAPLAKALKQMKDWARSDKPSIEDEASADEPATTWPTPTASLDIGILLSVSGDIAGGLGWKLAGGVIETDPEKAKIESGLNIKLEGIVKAEGKVCIIRSAGCVQFNASASLAIQSADGKAPFRVSGAVKPRALKPRGGKPPAGNYFNLEGVIECNGLAIWGSYSAEASVDADAVDLVQRREKASIKKSSVGVKQHTQLEKGSKELYRLFGPWRWPAAPTAAPAPADVDTNATTEPICNALMCT